MKAWMVVCALVGAAAMVEAGTVVSDLKAEYRQGQVFLTWQEAGAEGKTFNVYLSDKPITKETLAGAVKVCEWIGPRSAEDWWLDPANCGPGPAVDAKTGKPAVHEPQGFLIQEGGKRLDPAWGLHVHTVAPGEEGARFYAVTTSQEGKEDTTLELGKNSLARPVTQKVEPIAPVWQGKLEARPAAGAGAGKPLLLTLHAKGKRQTQNYLVFGTKAHAWREGIAFKFDVSASEGAVVLYPSDTMWVGRRFKEGNDGKTKNQMTTFTFWYGTSDQLYHADRIAKGTPTNYTERRLDWMVGWTRDYFKTDANRTYCTGGSMGGCGGMLFAFRRPDVFAAVYAHVPIVAYNEGDKEKGAKLGWQSNAFRVQPACGPLSLKCSDGMTLEERLDSRRFVASHPGDLPYLIITNGRKDASIPWHNNPDFYRAMQAGRHGFLAAWNDGAHGEVEGLLPADVKARGSLAGMMRFALNKSYPAFSRCSRDGSPGNGDSTSGDIVGYMNRGLDWTDPKDEAGRYETLVKWTLDAGDVPVTVDVTPRRVQAFRLKPGESCAAVNLDAGGKEVQIRTLTADANGLVTFEGFRITSAAGNRLVLTRK